MKLSTEMVVLNEEADEESTSTATVDAIVVYLGSRREDDKGESKRQVAPIEWRGVLHVHGRVEAVLHGGAREPAWFSPGGSNNGIEYKRKHR
jgi:hypothetical protein